MNRFQLSVSLVALLAGPQEMTAQDALHHVAKDLAPTQHPAISRARASALRRIGCMITQFADTRKLDGVIVGAFHAVGSKDLAVLCHHNGRQVVAIFWGSSPWISDSLFTGVHDPDAQLFVASRAYMIDHVAWYGPEDFVIPAGKDTPDYRQRLGQIISHSGIGLTSGECCSDVKYWLGRSWVNMPGAD